MGKEDKTDQCLPYGPFFSHQSPHIHLSYSFSESSPFRSAEGVYVKETSLSNHPGANLTVTLAPPELAPKPLCSCTTLGSLVSAVSLSGSHLAVTQIPEPFVVQSVGTSRLLPGASVTQSSICSLHIQPPALNDFLTLCYKRGVSHRQVQQFQKRGHVGLHLLSELQPSICAV